MEKIIIAKTSELESVVDTLKSTKEEITATTQAVASAIKNVKMINSVAIPEFIRSSFLGNKPKNELTAISAALKDYKYIVYKLDSIIATNLEKYEVNMSYAVWHAYLYLKNMIQEFYKKILDEEFQCIDNTLEYEFFLTHAR